MTDNIRQGLKENWVQFALLVLINAFVGSMIGLERSIFPQFAEEIFGIESKTAMLSFIVAFGISKALANYQMGKLANSIGRKKLLVIGWIIALPVPLILIYAPSWSWVILSNILLGVSQGLTWSSTVIMKIDLVGENDRGLAMGLNEFAGYFSVGVMAFVSGYVTSQYGIRPYPFYLGIGISILGLVMSMLFVQDTGKFVSQEQKSSNLELNQKNIFKETSFNNKTLSTITQAGLINNLNDGMIWGLLPVFLMSLKYDTTEVAILSGIYPTVWGFGQLFTGKMSDIFNKKRMLFIGMLIQAIGILCIPLTSDFYLLGAIGVLLGAGTALVYPTFLTGIADATTPFQRAESIGVFRLWRDLGYAVGAILSGIVADLYGVPAAIALIGVLTLISAIIIQVRMPYDLKSPSGAK